MTDLTPKQRTALKAMIKTELESRRKNESGSKDETLESR